MIVSGRLRSITAAARKQREQNRQPPPRNRSAAPRRTARAGDAGKNQNSPRDDNHDHGRPAARTAKGPSAAPPAKRFAKIHLEHRRPEGTFKIAYERSCRTFLP